MNSKSVILLGLLASLLLIFLCVFFNAERYYEELGLGTNSKNELASEAPLTDEVNESQELIKALSPSDDVIVETKDEDKVEAISVEKKEETSSFNYYVENNKTFISGNVPLLDNGDSFKEFIANCSKDKSCENSVTFLDNDESLSWKDFVSSALTIFTKEKIANPKLSIDKKEIKIEGEFSEQSGKDKLLTLVDKHKGMYIISDMTTVKKELKVEPKQVESKKDEEKKTTEKEPSTEEVKVKTPAKNLELEQEQISSLLKNNKITFKRNSGKIRKEGKKVLDEIAKLLKGKENILIDVEGYTDAGGKEKINLWISQARADGVKKYLIKKGIKADSITAKGFGEKKLLLPKAPYDPSNRRVEIHLKRK
jgi:outer membrane protein OmpA-like peptidoglycan-associated protein